jgi:hypothetical protein
MKFTFKHLTGSKAGQEQVFEGSVVGVGRNPTNQIAFDPNVDDRVSGNHAQLVVAGDTVSVNDLGSRNGTLVNGQKITGPTPVPSGAVIEFGQGGGPKVLVTYMASAAAPAPAAPPPAAPAPAPKKSNTGCIVCAVLGVLLLCPGLGVGGYFFYRSMGPGPEPTTDATTTTTDAQAPTTTEEVEATPATEVSTGPVAKKKSAWGALGVGSSFSQTVKTDMKMGETSFSSETNMTYTVLSNDDKVVTVEMKVSAANMPPTAQNTTFDVYPPDAQPGEKPEVLEERSASVTVPAGTFTCTYRKTKLVVAGAETITEVWQDDGEALPYKMVTTSPTSTSTMELTKIEKK